MKAFNNLKEFIINLEEKKFYTYLGITLGIVCALVIGIIYYNYRSINYWRKTINNINIMREDIKRIVDQDEQVLKQRQEVNAMLEEVPDFKIEGYFNELINRMGLPVPTETSITYADHGDPEYREVLLTAKFDTMNMRQLTELLNEIEQNKRIYSKDIEITKSKKMPNTIDVKLTVATLQRKPETTELVE